MAEYTNRAPYIGDLYGGWEKAINGIKEFNNLRPDYMRAHLSEITDVEESTSFGFSLHQNYPNPFNPTTTISFTVPNVEATHESPLQLRVYDVLGREVATLVNKNKKPGVYQVTFNAEDLSSGLYFYSIEVENFRAVKKMILLK
jgi:hypothetical protein